LLLFFAFQFYFSLLFFIFLFLFSLLFFAFHVYLLLLVSVFCILSLAYYFLVLDWFLHLASLASTQGTFLLWLSLLAFIFHFSLLALTCTLLALDVLFLQTSISPAPLAPLVFFYKFKLPKSIWGGGQASKRFLRYTWNQLLLSSIFLYLLNNKISQTPNPFYTLVSFFLYLFSRVTIGLFWYYPLEINPKT
jgi:hypothetical protein